jgi:hypothetical protein
VSITLGDLVQLCHQERRGTGNRDFERTSIGRVERVEAKDASVDERRFEPPRLACDIVAMNRESCAPFAGSPERFGHEQIELHAAAAPCPRLAKQSEPRLRESVREQRFVVQHVRTPAWRCVPAREVH